MKVLLGLGNPGREYEATRHNVGWWVLDHLADVWRFDGWRKDGDALTTTGLVGSLKVRLVKPQTYYNLSGTVLRTYLRKPFWAPATDLLVVCDDVALPVGRYRLRPQGGAGGSNGLKSIEREIGSQNYGRLRIGTKPVDEAREIGNLADFVLSPFDAVERQEVVALMPKLVDASETWLRDGILAAMNKHNSNG
ncbi:aminoacyl-tRNA hydrolase [Roseisolibacter agri]|uniref:Peptidyl-tRNA hydrolase n=1 Tax=Roseisolibacter agri TaxID=2014610 RepID=A0AA37Q4V0_9BACT|nr:aminoacyl-tRNA hydrolase [Roseisolibacter agri]GLC26364.1 peptidyl-tRNA hydrolase [Roseisolibacter agri]